MNVSVFCCPSDEELTAHFAASRDTAVRWFAASEVVAKVGVAESGRK